MYKVFIVEDEYLELEALDIMLNNSSKEIKVIGKACSGKVAWEEIQKLQPDIVLMDIHLPEMNGIEVLRLIKKELPKTKVILITAYAEFDYAYQAIKAKVDDLLIKPIRQQQLTEAIIQAIGEIQLNIKTRFDEKMNEIIFAIVQKKYNDTKNALTGYVDVLYDNCGNDLITIQNEVSHFMHELNQVSIDMCGYEIKSSLRKHANHQQFVKAYQNRYNLKIEIMKFIDRIFDKLLDTPDSHKNNMEDIINYIDRHCKSEISLDLVGEYANMSSYYLSKIFKKEMGVNFVTYLTMRKIEIAKDMLVNTDIPIINIALELSYHEPNYFSKVFKRSTGYTPSEYRKHFKKNNV